MQKSFWSNISLHIEHTESHTYLQNNAKIKQTRLVVTIVDPQNTFGKNHNFLPSGLKFHYLHIRKKTNLTKNLYNGYQISIVTNDFTEPPITTEKEELRGERLSPYLFNKCFKICLMLMVNQA